MVISRIREKLLKYPHVAYTTAEGSLEIPALSPTGFKVWIREHEGQHAVGFEGWHEEFADADTALKCFGFGLSPACRLRVFRCLGTDYKWQVLSQVDGEWVIDSEVSLIFPTLFLPKKQRDLRNEIVAAPSFVS